VWAPSVWVGPLWVPPPPVFDPRHVGIRSRDGSRSCARSHGIYRELFHLQGLLGNIVLTLLTRRPPPGTGGGLGIDISKPSISIRLMARSDPANAPRALTLVPMMLHNTPAGPHPANCIRPYHGGMGDSSLLKDTRQLPSQSYSRTYTRPLGLFWYPKKNIVYSVLPYFLYYGARARAGGTCLVAVLHAASVIRCWGCATGAASVIVCW